MNKNQSFIIWLQGVLDSNEEGFLNQRKTKMVKNKLNDLFVHEANAISVRQPTKAIVRQQNRNGKKC